MTSRIGQTMIWGARKEDQQRESQERKSHQEDLESQENNRVL